MHIKKLPRNTLSQLEELHQFLLRFTLTSSLLTGRKRTRALPAIAGCTHTGASAVIHCCHKAGLRWGPESSPRSGSAAAAFILPALMCSCEHLFPAQPELQSAATEEARRLNGSCRQSEKRIHTALLPLG